MIGSGPFKNEYVKHIDDTRMSRFTEEQRFELKELIEQFYSEEIANDDDSLSRIGEMMEIADTYHHYDIDDEKYSVSIEGDLFKSIWDEASHLRSSGELLAMGNKIECDVAIIHGDYDPHPIAGVVEPLSDVINNLKTIKLEKCGHSPWKEKYAHEALMKEIKNLINV